MEMMVGVESLINTSNYIWYILFSVLIYIYASDENVQKYVYLLFQLGRITIIRKYMMVQLGLRLRWDIWNMKRSLKKISK